MAELFFHHDANTYLYDTNLLKLYRFEGCQPVEVDNPETQRKVRLNSAEISRETAIKMIGSVYRLKDRTILSPSLDPSHQGREDFLLPLDGGGRVGVK